MKEVIDELKKVGCCICKELEVCCLDFHHLRDKVNNVSTMALCGWSLEKIIEEVAKCVVICSNCHRKLHAGLITIGPKT